MWHGYFVMEALSLTAGQKSTLVAALRQLGPARDDSPARLMQFRPRLDNNAAIFEAAFEDEVLTVAAWKNRLAQIFNVQAVNIAHTVGSATYAERPSPIVTFRYGATDRIRVILFGGTDATWPQSGTECRAYLAANLAQWETQDEN